MASIASCPIVLPVQRLLLQRGYTLTKQPAKRVEIGYHLNESHEFEPYVQIIDDICGGRIRFPSNTFKEYMEVRYVALRSHLLGQEVKPPTDFNGVRTRLVKAHGRQGVEFGEPSTSKYILLVGPTYERLLSLKNIIYSCVSLLNSLNQTIYNIVDDYVSIIHDSIPRDKRVSNPSEKSLASVVDWDTCEMFGMEKLNSYDEVLGDCSDIVSTVIGELTMFYRDYLLRRLVEKIKYHDVLN